ncbi:hypothetical protein [Flavobacterium haoranii]|uniref:Secreted protein n=1 Tax=Flavobacterium haoranii TaxID=683124 RepID=A0A1M6EFZ7_9FLAO|nr:hypothetical protein [Flavobacterium haoranii]SHI84447.1 hypothetical protein SAMN05444337_0937 [Flavobacterium haoranii]
MKKVILVVGVMVVLLLMSSCSVDELETNNSNLKQQEMNYSDEMFQREGEGDETATQNATTSTETDPISGPKKD